MFNQLLGYWGHTSVVVFSLRRWLAVIDDASAARHTPLSVCLSLSLLFKPSNASLLAEVWLIEKTVHIRDEALVYMHGVVISAAHSTTLGMYL